MRLVLLLSVLGVALSAVSEPRHLRLTKSDPVADAVVTAVPDTLQLWYNQNVHINVSADQLGHGSRLVKLPTVIPVEDKKSFRVAVPDSARQGSGTYKVMWTTAGDDEHVVKGEFAFVVK